MTAQRDTDRLIRAFLDEGVAELPDRAFDAVRGEIHRTRQRAVFGSWREPRMTTLARVAIAAAAVFAVGLAWVNFGAPKSGVGGPNPSSSPSPSVSPSVVVSASPAGGIANAAIGTLAPGTYRLGEDGSPGAPDPARLIVTVPARWSYDGILYRDTSLTDGIAFTPWEVIGTAVDPCTNHTLKTPTPPAGVDGIDELVAALTHQPGIAAKPPTAVTIDGYAGTMVEITLTPDVDITTCPGGGFFVWASPADDFRFVQGNEETNRIWILNVGGERYSFLARIPKGVPADELAELDSVVRSIQIEPRP